MAITISTQLYEGATLEQIWPLLDKVADPQVGVEVFPEPQLTRYAPMLRRAMPRLRRCPTTMHGPYWGIDPCFLPPEPEAAVYEKYWRQTLADAREMGAAYVVYHMYNFRFAPEERKAKREAAMQTLALTRSWAAEYGVKLAIENTETRRCAEENMLTQQEFVELVRAQEDCGVLIDIGHVACADWDMTQLIADLHDRIVGYHLHNNDGFRDLHQPILQGVIDMERWAADARRYTPDAILTLEYDPRFVGDEETICSDILWLKRRGLG